MAMNRKKHIKFITEEKGGMEDQIALFRAKMFLIHVEEAKEWIERMIGKKIVVPKDGKTDFMDVLKSCEHLSALGKKFRKKKHRVHENIDTTSRMAFMKLLDNFQNFNSSCIDTKFPKFSLFSFEDLYKRKNVTNVIQTIHAFAHHLVRNKFIKAEDGIKDFESMMDSFNFTDEQLRRILEEFRRIEKNKGRLNLEFGDAAKKKKQKEEEERRRRKKEEEERLKRLAEERRRREEEAKRLRQLEEERKRLERERLRLEEAARRRLELEKQKKLEKEEKRRLEEEKRQRLEELERQRKLLEEEKRRLEEEARKADEEARRRREEEERRLRSLEMFGPGGKINMNFEEDDSAFDVYFDSEYEEKRALKKLLDDGVPVKVNDKKFDESKFRDSQMNDQKKSKNLYEEGHKHFRLGEYEDALDKFTEAKELSPDIGDIYHWKGRSAEKCGKNEESVMDYTTALLLDENDLSSLVRRADLNSRVFKKHQEAVDDITEALDKNPRCAEYLFKRSDILGNYLGDNESALEDVNKAIDMYPDLPKGYLKRAEIYARMKDHEKALNDYNKAIEVDPNNALLYFKRGEYFQKERNVLTSALNDFKKALLLDPKYGKAYDYRAYIYKTQGEPEKALSDYNSAIEHGYEISLLHRGILHEESFSNFDEALKDMNNYIKFDSKQFEGYFNRAMLLEEDHFRRIEDSIEDYNKVIEINPEYAEAYDKKGFLLEQELNDPDEALKCYDKCLSLDPEFIPCLIHRGTLNDSHFADFTKALNDYNKAIDLIHEKEKEPEKHQGIAEVYYARGFLLEDSFQKYEEALEDYSSAIEINSNDFESILGRGMILMNQFEEFESALEDFNKCLEMRPDDEETLEAKKRCEIEIAEMNDD